jgi:hypothetical protein
MAIAWARYVDGTTSSGSTTAAVNLGSCSANDLVFVLISRASTTANSAISNTGWQLLQSHSSTHGRWLYYKRLEQSDLTTVTWTFGASSVRTLAHAACYTGAAVRSSAKNTFATAAGTSCDCGSITSTQPWLVQFASGYSTSSRSYTAQASWPERRDNGGTTPDLWNLICDTNGTWSSGASNPSFVYDSSATCTYRGGFQVELENWTAPATFDPMGMAGVFGI